MRFLRSRKRILIAPVLIVFLVAAGAASVALAVCGPFTDVGSLVCPFALSIYYLGVTAGTTSTTYSPNDPVSRGQMAIFMGALYKQVKRTDNPYRVATGQNLAPFNGNRKDYFVPGDTDNPNGFCTDGQFDYVANQGNTTIDVFNRSGWQKVNTITTTTPNNRLACDGAFLYATSVYGTTIKQIDLETGAVTDPWMTVPSGANDIANAGDYLVVTTSSGVTCINKDGGIVGTAPVGSGTINGVAFDGVVAWASYGNTLTQVFPEFGTAGTVVPLDGNAVYYSAFDGQNVWVPLDDQSIDVVAVHGAQAGTIVDHIPAPSSSDFISGIVFTGQYMMVGYHCTASCCASSSTTSVTAIDILTHQQVGSEAHFCDGAYDYTLGWDGQHVWALGWGGNVISIY